MLRTSRRYFLFALCVAGALTSCKAPTAPSSNPTLTLILPDSAHAYDTLTFHVKYSDSVEPPWKFAWQFGDSTHDTTVTGTATHIYDSIGMYLVQVALIDSSKTIAKQNGKLQVLPLNGPSLTLTAPDTVYWGDSCVMSASSSQPIQPSRKYTWSFGDTTTFSSQKDSVLHWYLNPGTYTVRVQLDDTARHIPLGSRTITVHVVARHFDLGLLQKMKYVDYSDNGNLTPNIGLGPCPLISMGKPLAWNGLMFSYDTAYGSTDTVGSGNYGYVNSNGGALSISGSIDSFNIGLQLFRESASSSSSSMRNDGGDWSKSSCESGISVSIIPFIEESDSEVVFQSEEKLISASFGWSSTSQGRFQQEEQFSAHKDWSNPNSYVRIRFHK